MTAIDATARVADSARIGDGVEIGPYCLVGPHVELKGGVLLVAHVYVTGDTTIDEGTVVYPFTSLGTAPQSVHYHAEPTKLVIGPQCQIREGVTMNIGTAGGGGITRDGARGFFMVSSHVGHDCDVGDDVTFANNAVIGGHVSIGNNVFLGGNSAVHQFCRVGEGAMVGGLSGVAADVVPFGFALGQVAKLIGLNVVGLRRRGTSRADLRRLRQAYRMLFLGEGVFAERVEKAAIEFVDDPLAQKVIAFIRGGGKRALMHPAATRAAEDSDADGI